METYLREFAASLRLSPEETRAIVAEVRGQLEDLIAHLQTQGYTPEQTEEEAVRRFDDADGLARALRRVHRPAPLPLRLGGLLLLPVGALGAALGLVMLLRTVVVVLSPGLRAYPTLWSFRNLFLAAHVGDKLSALGYALYILGIAVLPALSLLLVALLSLWVAATVLRRHGLPWGHWGVRATILLGLNGVAGVILVGTLTLPPTRWEANVPDDARLIAQGLSGTPGPGQPHAPVVVDRVLADTGATYVVSHPAAGLFTDGEPLQPTLSDDKGRTYNPVSGVGPGGSGLQAMVPWHPPLTQEATYAGLAPDAHAAILTFLDQGRAVETVRVPLDLHALQRAGGTIMPQTTAVVHGVVATLTQVTRGAAVSTLRYTLNIPRGALAAAGIQGMAGPAAETLAGPRNPPLVLTPVRGTCGGRAGGAESCTTTWGFVAPARGTHLVFVIPDLMEFTGNKRPHILHGPWLLPFVMP